MSALLLRLAGPTQAWDSRRRVSQYDGRHGSHVGPIGLMPTYSAIIGLLGAAPIREGFEPRHSTRVATPRTMPTFDRVGVPPWRAPHSTIRRRHLTSTCIGPNRRGRDAQMIGNLSDRPLPELHAANGPILRSAAATPSPIRISFSVRQEWVNPW